LSAAHPDAVFYFDPHDALCNGDICTVFGNGKDVDNRKMLYGDGMSHFRPDYPNPLLKQWKVYLTKVL
jgi:hypothetical protein